MQGIARDLFGLDKGKNSGHDLFINGTKIEMKSARWCKDGKIMWEHIMKSHVYDYVLFALVDFQDIKFWLVSKEVILANPELFIKQGGGEGQGLWVSGNARKIKRVTDVCTPIHSREDLLRAISVE
jgi:hypothetical protein